MSFMTCCALHCMVNKKEGVLHKFPHLGVEAERFRRWVDKIGIPATGLDSVQSQQEGPQAIVAEPTQSTLLDITNLSHTGVNTKMKLDFGKESLSMDISCAQPAIPQMDMASSSRKGYLVEPEVTKATNIVMDVCIRITMPMDVAIPRQTGNKNVSKKKELKTPIFNLKADLRRANTLKMTFKKRLGNKRCVKLQKSSKTCRLLKLRKKKAIKEQPM